MSELPIVTLPRIEDALPGVNPEARTGEEDKAYNTLCTSLVREALEAEAAAGRPAKVKTAYPDQPPAFFDTVTLDEQGEIVIVFEEDE